jgi:hypothetical protein
VCQNAVPQFHGLAVIVPCTLNQLPHQDQGLVVFQRTRLSRYLFISLCNRFARCGCDYGRATGAHQATGCSAVSQRRHTARRSMRHSLKIRRYALLGLRGTSQAAPNCPMGGLFSALRDANDPDMKTPPTQEEIMGLFTRDIKTMDDLFVHMLRDIYYAENQIVKALPDTIEKATDPGQKQGFQAHLGETKNHVKRLEQVFRMHDVEVSGIDCPAIDGIIEEANEVAGEADTKNIMDAADLYDFR